MCSFLDGKNTGHAKLLHSCLTLCNTLDHSLPGSYVHGILQARVLEWVAMPSSRESSPPREQTCVSYISCIGRCILYHLSHLRDSFFCWFIFSFFPNFKFLFQINMLSNSTWSDQQIKTSTIMTILRLSPLTILEDWAPFLSLSFPVMPGRVELKDLKCAFVKDSVQSPSCF